MRFEQFEPKQVNEEQLDEVRMGTSDLEAFVNSSEAQGIKAGFEAEMCFVGKGGSQTDYDNQEEDWDQDERVSDIDDACNFFNDGDYNGRREVQDLRDAMQESFWEWQSEKMSDAWYEVREDRVREYIQQNDYNEDDEIDNYLTDNLDLSREQADAVLAAADDRQGNPEAYATYIEAKEYAEAQLEELVRQALDDEDRSYDYAREEWEEEVRDDYSEYDWLREIGVYQMSDVLNEFSGHVTWPHYTYGETEGGYSEYEAQELADDLANTLNVETYASGGYHSARRTATRWIFEPDSSLEADDGDMPVEIISPPMPLGECLQKIQEFFMWADSNEAYTNNSTGFHVGVSLPHVGGKIDYVKLALFLGDKHVLGQFDRIGNYYCKSAFDKIKDGSDPQRVVNAFEIIRKGLIELASKTLGQTGGHGKYTSINLKNDYVEFRSMGDQYHTKVPEIINTVKRYAYAMHIASRPDLHRQEYAKKLYLMLSKSGEADGVNLFSQFSAGNMSKEDLVQKLRTRKVDRAVASGEASGKRFWWNVVFPGNSRIEVVAANKKEAIEVATKEKGYHDDAARAAVATYLRPYEEQPVKATAGEPQPVGRANDRVGNLHFQIRVLASDGEWTPVREFLAHSREEAEAKYRDYVQQQQATGLGNTRRYDLVQN